MAECEEQVFSGVTQEHLGLFLAKGESLGMPKLTGDGNTGEASHSGVTIRWNFNPEANTLAVHCTKSPMLLPCSLINGKIKDAVAWVLRQPVAGGASMADKEQV